MGPVGLDRRNIVRAESDVGLGKPLLDAGLCNRQSGIPGLRLTYQQMLSAHPIEIATQGRPQDNCQSQGDHQNTAALLALRALSHSHITIKVYCGGPPARSSHPQYSSSCPEWTGSISRSC